MSLSPKLVNDFGIWLDDALLAAADTSAQAFNFNLYQAAETWDVELIGADEFDDASPDLACDPVFSYPELFFIPQSLVGVQWEKGLATALDLVILYIRGGRQRDVLRSSIAVGVGFVDGDLTIVWPESAA